MTKLTTYGQSLTAIDTIKPMAKRPQQTTRTATKPVVQSVGRNGSKQKRVDHSKSTSATKETTLNPPMSDTAFSFYQSYTRQNGFYLTDEEIRSLNHVEVLGDSMLPRHPKGTVFMVVKRSRESLPQAKKVAVVYLWGEPDRACAGRIKEVTEQTITISPDNPDFRDQVFDWAKVEAIYEVLWYSYHFTESPVTNVEEVERKKMSLVEEYTHLFKVVGHSMHPTMPDGTILKTKRRATEEWRAVTGMAVLNLTGEQELFLARRVSSVSQNTLTISADNSTYDSLTIDWSMVKAVYDVVSYQLEWS